MDEKTLDYLKKCRADVHKAYEESNKNTILWNEYLYWDRKYHEALVDKQTKEKERWELIETSK